MCLDPRKPESGPVLAAAGLAERLRLSADDSFAAAAEIDHAAAEIEELRALVARLRARLVEKQAEIDRLLKGGRGEG